jgi:flagellar protein FlgJ
MNMGSASQLQVDVYTDFEGLAKLRTAARKDSPEALREVARQFEALFVGMMMKGMREASLGEGLFDNDQSRMYQGMYDRQVSLELVKGQGLGLAELLVRQLSPEMAREGAGTSGQPRDLRLPTERLSARPVGATAAAASPSTEMASSPTDAQWRPETPRQFVAELWPHAERAARELGTEPEVLVAQAALETGWGRAMLERSDGHPGYNLFGIKADGRWDGLRVTAGTLEYRDGVMRQERANFRAYDSVAESFSDYVDFLRSNPRYREVLQGLSGTEYAAALQRAGYATDPEYAAKIGAILQSPIMAEGRLAADNPAGEVTHG